MKKYEAIEIPYIKDGKIDFYKGFIEVEEELYSLLEGTNEVKRQYFAGYCESVNEPGHPQMVLGYKKLYDARLGGTTIYRFSNVPNEPVTLYCLSGFIGYSTGTAMESDGGSYTLKMRTSIQNTPITGKKETAEAAEYLRRQKQLASKLTEPNQKQIADNLKKEKKMIKDVPWLINL